MKSVTIYCFSYVALALTEAFAITPAMAETKTWTDWHYDSSVDPETNTVSSKAEVVVEEGDDGDLYALNFFCIGKRFAASFRAADRHFKTGDIAVTWKSNHGKRHIEKKWQVVAGSDQVIYAQSPQDLMVKMLKGKEFDVQVTDAMGKSVAVTFPVFGAQPAIEDALSSCSGKGGPKFSRVPVERDALYLLLTTNGDLIYPTKARRNRKDGYAELSFSVTEKGTVTDAKILSEDPPGFGFGEAAVATVERWSYKPEIKEGVAVARKGIRMRLTFKLTRK